MRMRPNGGRNRTARLTAALAAAALILLLALAAGCVKNPVTGEDQMMFLTPAQDVALGQENFPKVVQLNYGKLPDRSLDDYVNRVGKKVASHSHTPGWPWEFAVVNNSAFNAFALPGGKIAVTRGLLVQMNSEDELAAVLGHEIGHVTARHSAAQYSRNILAGLLMAGLAVALSDNEYGDEVIKAAGVAGGLMMLSYSRDQERQADELGYLYMTRAGYNPKGMVNLFGIFQKVEKGEPSQIAAWMSSHPLTSERIRYAQNMVARSSPALVNQPFRKAEFDRVTARLEKTAPAYAAMDKGDALFAKGRFADAAAWQQKAIRTYSGEGMFYTSLAQSYMKLNRRADAVAAARDGVRRSPNVFFGQLMLGLAYTNNRDYKQALNAYAKADKLYPDHPMNLYLAGDALQHMGKTSQAAQLYRKVVQLDPQGKYGQAARQRLAGK